MAAHIFCFLSAVPAICQLTTGGSFILGDRKGVIKECICMEDCTGAQAL